jgi:hypothetical protein
MRKCAILSEGIPKSIRNSGKSSDGIADKIKIRTAQIIDGI